MDEENDTESKANECLGKALPCPHCGGDEVCYGISTIDEADEDGDEYTGRFYCAACGASTRRVLLGCYNNGEDCDIPDARNSFYWECVLAAWNLRAPSVSGCASPPPASPQSRPAQPPRPQRALPPPARAKTEKPPASSRVNPLLDTST